MSDGKFPQYRCHKIVHAVQIKAIEHRIGGVVHIVPVEAGIDPIVTTDGWATRHPLHVGGFYVVYDDGYASFSPEKAFREGYARIE